jgi:predicted nucleic acid-binding protein
VSRRTANELDGAKPGRRKELQASYDSVPKLEDDHLVKGIQSVDLGVMGWITQVEVVDALDEEIVGELRRMLSNMDMDAKHLAVAIHNKVDVFLTRDKKILKRREKIRRRYPATPSALLEQLQVAPDGETR